MSKKKTSINLIVSIILFIVYVTTYVIDFFTIKTITLSSVLLCVGALIVYTLFLRKIKSVYYLGLLTFTFFAQYLGAMLHLYVYIPIYDIILHFGSGTLLVLAADYVYTLIMKKYKTASVPQLIRLLLCFLTSVASAAVWEIWEYSGDVIIGLNSQGSLEDTMTDIIAGTCGAIIGVFLLRYILNKSKKSKKENNK